MKIFLKELFQYNKEKNLQWKDGVLIAGELLVKNGFVTSNYCEKVIQVTNELGPYYIIAPNLALLHIYPDETILKAGLAFTYFKYPLQFKPEQKYHVQYCLALAATDGNAHMEMLQKIALLFMNQEFLTALKKCSSLLNLEKIIIKYDL